MGSSLYANGVYRCSGSYSLFTEGCGSFHSSNINKRRSGGYDRTYFTGSSVTKGLNSSISFNRDVTKCCSAFDAYRVY